MSYDAIFPSRVAAHHQSSARVSLQPHHSPGGRNRAQAQACRGDGRAEIASCGENSSDGAWNSRRRVVVASRNPVKINAAGEALRRLFPHESFELEGFPADSGVSDQPMGDAETLTGARNRLLHVARSSAAEGADFVVAIEGGVEWCRFSDPPQLMCFAWAVVLSTSARAEDEAEADGAVGGSGNVQEGKGKEWLGRRGKGVREKVKVGGKDGVTEGREKETKDILEGVGGRVGGKYGRGEYGRGKYGRGKYGRGKYGRGKYGRGKYGRGKYGRGKYGRGKYGREVGHEGSGSRGKGADRVGGMELGEATDEAFRQEGSKSRGGTVGYLTNGEITRQTYYEHAITLALIPFVHPSLYKSPSHPVLPPNYMQ
ncbi:unnamed protein product [Closterium sp. NIES-64]|nr:unnamed protein product [Closterium sp. NIES-64]